jgi:hypothetical protein
LLGDLLCQLGMLSVRDRASLKDDVTPAGIDIHTIAYRISECNVQCMFDNNNNNNNMMMMMMIALVSNFGIVATALRAAGVPFGPRDGKHIMEKK